MDRIHENQILGVEEYLLEYSWLIDDPNNKFNQILARLVDVLKDEHENWKNKKIIDELVQLEMGEPKQKKRKNKKKKNSKKTEEKSEKESSEKDEEQSKQKDSKQ